MLALEIMVATPAIRSLIREGKAHQITTHLQTGGRWGMQTMDAALASLCRQGLISRKELVNRTRDQELLHKLIRRVDKNATEVPLPSARPFRQAAQGNGGGGKRL